MKLSKSVHHPLWHRKKKKKKISNVFSLTQQGKKLNAEVLKVSKNYLKAPSGNVSKNSTDINVLLIKLKLIKTLISIHKVVCHRYKDVANVLQEN